MTVKLPVFACADIRKVILEGEFDWWCESNNVDEFFNIIKNGSMNSY